MRLVIPRDYLEKIVKTAKNSAAEVCGFLFGGTDGGSLTVKEIRFVTNRLNSPTAFEMEPLEMVEAIDGAEEGGLEVIGIFHSHLNCPPRPSGKDLRGMNLWPVVWLIVTPEGEARAWVLKDEGIEEVEIVHPEVARGMFGEMEQQRNSKD
ncbi:M67 family peptidase [Thermococcus sp. M36]|uniref:M67 family metallopeptidase n=1 Tax=Thermococcus sp. M36 TaxID=1638261 RepID=UPI001438D4BB|nr:M67 family metallopeptidase [Thermococcus sp. M36]NJE04896.1 M67 family peptidase [Thermococcus sp. M36]